MLYRLANLCGQFCPECDGWIDIEDEGYLNCPHCNTRLYADESDSDYEDWYLRRQINMPYQAYEEDSQYCVYKLNEEGNATGESLGCHDTEEEAQDQIAALNAQEETDRQAENLFFKFWNGIKRLLRQDELIQATLDHIRGEFNKEFNTDNNWNNWVIDASDSFIIADFSGTIYKVPYKMVEENIIFANRNEWREVQVTYEERAASLYSIQEKAWERAMEKYPMAFLHDVFTDDSGSMFAILSQEGMLYRSPITIENEQVTLEDWVQVTQEFPEVATRTTVLRQGNKYRWFSISATSTLNRVGEIDSRELFDSFVDYIERTGNYPTRQFYHLGEQFRTGQCDFVARDGYCLITSGEYDDTEFAQLEVQALQDEPDYWGESIRYQPTIEPEFWEVNGINIPVYRNGYLVEITSLPEGEAANLFTTTKEVSRMSLPKRVMDALVKRFGNDESAAMKWLEENVDETNRSIEDQNLIARQTEEEVQEVEVELDFDAELEKAIDDKIEAAIARAFENQEPDTALDEIKALLTEFKESVNQRFEALEKPEQERTQEVIDDMPRKKVQVMYRPRTQYVEEVEVVPANEIAANNRPSNAY